MYKQSPSTSRAYFTHKPCTVYAIQCASRNRSYALIMAMLPGMTPTKAFALLITSTNTLSSPALFQTVSESKRARRMVCHAAPVPGLPLRPHTTTPTTGGPALISS